MPTVSLAACPSSSVASPGEFVAVSYPNPHARRAREILRAHPEVRALLGPARPSFAVIAGLTSAQLAIAWLARGASAWALVGLGYTVGALFTIGLYNMLHEASHGLVFRSRAMNRFAAFLANATTVLPVAESFIKYHAGHHKHLGSYERDVSIPRRREAEIVGRSAVTKALFFALWPVLYPLRVYGMNVRQRGFDGWLIANIAVQIAVNAAIASLWGPRAFAYLLLSFLFGFGLHPLNAMTLQEHTLVKPGQDSYSYYGPANLITFNAGYHNEHHDFPRMPWCRIQRLRRVAPEFYEGLHSYSSWTGLLVAFLADRDFTLWRRAVRVERPGHLSSSPPDA